LRRLDSHAAFWVVQERKQLVDHGACALIGRDLTDGLRRGGSYGFIPVAEEREQLVDRRT
jgi:hypothetical protein